MLAADLFDRLIDFPGADASGDRASREARRAMQDAIRAFPALHSWTYLYKHGRIQLVASYSTGTVAYTHSTLTLTLTTGTWPSWAALGRVRIGDVISEVATRTSDSILVLDSVVNPGADIDSGTEFVIYQDKYILPADFIATDAALAESTYGEMCYVHPQSHMWATRIADRSGDVYYYTFVASETADRLAMLVFPYPDRAMTVDFLYRRRPRPVKYDRVEAGKVSITTGTTALTGVGTAFRADMVGSRIRLSRDLTKPTGFDGNNAAAFEASVTAVGSTTTLTLAEAPTETFANVAYVLSDPIDVEEGTMATALAWQAIAHLAQNLQMKNRDAAMMQAASALILAKEANARNLASGKVGPNRTGRRIFYPTGPDE